MPVTAYGKPLCRHKPPAMCDRWWCSYKRMVYILLVTGVISVVLYLWVDHRHPASFERPTQQYIVGTSATPPMSPAMVTSVTSVHR